MKRGEETFEVVGKRKDGLDEKSKVSGDVLYADDFSMEKMLYGKVFRSTRASAKIKSINTGNAEKLPGVITVITAEDVPHNRSVTNVVGQSVDVGLLQARHRVLAEDRVRFYGEPIALVAAEDPEIADEALKLIEVEYKDLRGVFDPKRAMKDDAPKVHTGSNIIARWKLRKGDIEKGFKNSDIIVENTYETQFQEHGHMEPESGVAWIDDHGILNLRVSTQVIEQYREISRILGIPESKVRIRGTLIGGGFGGKEDLTVEPYLALLAWKTKRPVKITYTREEMMYGRHKRHPFKMKYKHGATEDGELVAMEAELISDSGAYVYLSPWVLLYATYLTTGPYRIPNIRVDSYSVLTNNTYTSAMRCFGGAQVAVAYESQMDELANKLEMDPMEIRAKNYLRRGDETGTGQIIDSEVWLEKTQKAVMEELEKNPAQPGAYKKVGRGFASCWQPYGRMVFLHDTSSAWVGMEEDGTAVIRCGIPDLGGGQRESLRQIAAEVLGISLEDISVISSDSQVTPLAGTVTATRALYMSGNAVRLASEEIRGKMLEKASEILEESIEKLGIREGEIYSLKNPEKKLGFSEVVKICHSGGIPLQALKTFKAPFEEPITEETLKGPVFPDFTFGSQAAEVEVDTYTGEVRVRRLVSAYDVGRAINPKRVEGQMEGGAVQGLGYALIEDFIVEDGIPKTIKLTTYTLPTSVDAPKIKPIILESKSGKGPFGAKGIGEPSMTATAPAILNAIYDAIGERVKKLPANPERIFHLIQGGE